MLFGDGGKTDKGSITSGLTSPICTARVDDPQVFGFLGMGPRI